MAIGDGMLQAMLSRLGVKPQDVIDGLQFVLAETASIKTDRESYKAAVQRFVPSVMQFMERTDKRLDRLEQIERILLDVQSRLPPRAIEAPALEADHATPKLLNGAAQHE